MRVRLDCCPPPCFVTLFQGRVPLLVVKEDTSLGGRGKANYPPCGQRRLSSHRKPAKALALGLEEPTRGPSHGGKAGSSFSLLSPAGSLNRRNRPPHSRQMTRPSRLDRLLGYVSVVSSVPVPAFLVCFRQAKKTLAGLPRFAPASLPDSICQ